MRNLFGFVKRSTGSNPRARNWNRPRRVTVPREFLRTIETRQLRRLNLRQQAYVFMKNTYPGESRRQQRKIARARAQNLWKVIRAQETKIPQGVPA